MKPRKVSEDLVIKHEFNIWEFDEIVFVQEYDNLLFGVLREVWEDASKQHDSMLELYSEVDTQETAYLLVSRPYWRNYKKNARWQYDYAHPQYMSNIAEAWENGLRSHIVLDLYDYGYFQDLNGNIVNRLIWDTLYEDDYDMDVCKDYIQQHPEYFGPVNLEGHINCNGYYLEVCYKVDVQELNKVVKDLMEDLYNCPDAEEYFTKKHFGEFIEYSEYDWENEEDEDW